MLRACWLSHHNGQAYLPQQRLSAAGAPQLGGTVLTASAIILAQDFHGAAKLRLFGTISQATDGLNRQRTHKVYEQQDYNIHNVIPVLVIH